MTSHELAVIVYPYVKHSFMEYNGDGRIIVKTVLRPFWFPITRLGIEIAVALMQPKVSPLLPYLKQLLQVLPDDLKKWLSGFLDLMTTSREEFCGE